jgi:tripartite-type tricarboxylate transporter receptor subunit TctC
MTIHRRTLIKLCALALPASAARAQPIAGGKTIRIVVPLSTGTPSDAMTRIIAPRISAILGQTVIVENKPGANGVIAVQDVMRAAPDGTTMMMGSVSPLAINMALVKNLPYDPRKDLTPIANVYSANHAWLVNAALPVRSIPELIAHAKANPGKVSAGHSSTLVLIQLFAMQKAAGIELLLVPYKSTATNITDLLGGTVDLSLLDMGTSIAQSKGTQVRVLGVSTLRRNPLAPDWPAVSETLPGFSFGSWSALVGPPGMPRDVTQRLSAAVAEVLKQKDVADLFAQGGSVPQYMTPAELQAHIDTEVSKYVSLAREAKLEPQ